MTSNWTAANIPDLTGKTAIVTGANSGIGYETARALTRRGAAVILACRSQDKGEAAVRQICQDHPEAMAELVQLDLSDLAADGFERQFGTNHLGHFALTSLLLDLILRTPQARVVTVSSGAYGAKTNPREKSVSGSLPIMITDDPSEHGSIVDWSIRGHRFQS